MRAYLASSIGVACTAALALPLAVYPGPAHARAERIAAPGSTQSLPLLPLAADGLDRGVTAPGDAPAPPPADRGVTAPRVRPFSLVGVVWDQPSADLRGRVQVRTRAVGGAWSPWRELLPYGDEAPDPDSPELRGVRAHGGTAPLWVGDSDGVQARVRPEGAAVVDGGGGAAADGGTGADGGGGAGADGGGGAGADAGTSAEVNGGAGADARAAALPSGLRLELIDPGAAPAPPPPDRAVLRALPAHPVPTAGGVAPGARPSVRPSAGPTAGSSGKPAWEPSGPARWSARPSPRPSMPSSPSVKPSWPSSPSVKPSWPSKWSAQPSSPRPSRSSAKPLPYPSIHATDATHATHVAPSTPPPDVLAGEATKANAARYSAPRPSIVTRAGWGADEKIRETGHVYSKTVKVAFIHHTVTGNKYSCSQAPSVLRSIYRYHVKSLGWRDYGYNFTIDKCGKIYEGRSGGVAKAVRGAHTLGFNTNSMGVAVLGTFSAKKPPAKAVKAIAKLTAWKLGLFKRNPRGTTHLVSGGGNKYKKGANVKLHVIAGHRDGFATECPGKDLYKKLGSVRKTAARLQGR
ncbi:peptidoglycan recognition protein [Streptomyces sp. PSAA01]|uniref:peptidoglycan recognition protein family protein n=1 Tax=Streptomyces sp. PSAA01 TaxID=2912762 RepID=UPI001F48CDA3|nr:peptidoglycan recognition protein [Streptomyces sp. PSAA01]MCG0287490.1 peptidoglycan recognition protein [Streptomyces sp. PSAA01]